MKNLRKWAFAILIIALMALLMLTQTSCGSATMYWGQYVRTASGKHYRQTPGWGNRSGCEAMHHRQYIKESTIRRQRWQ